MPQDLHHHYDQLTPDEKAFVDEMFKEIFATHKIDTEIDSTTPKLANDDRAERAVDAIAQWVIESR